MGSVLVTFNDRNMQYVSPNYNKKERQNEVEVNHLLHLTIYHMMSLPDVFIFKKGSFKD